MSEIYDSIMASFEETIKASKNNTLKTTYVIRPVIKYSGKEVKEIRNKLGLTQLVFAGALGVSKKTIEAWESGKNNPTGPALRLMELLVKQEISIDMLVKGR